MASETVRTFLQNLQNMTFYVFELLHTFSRTLAQHDNDWNFCQKTNITTVLDRFLPSETLKIPQGTTPVA